MNISISHRNSLNLLLQGRSTLLQEIREYFTDFAPGYEFQWAYQAGRWDGKISVFEYKTKELPLGLLFDLMKFKKLNYPDDKWEIAPEVKNAFKGIDLELNWDLNLTPRDYQEECIRSALKLKKGIFRVATSGGKCTKDIEIEIEMDDYIFSKYFG